MIEQYIVPGAKFKWAFPASGKAAKEGKLIASPQIPVQPMIFMGMDPHGFKAISRTAAAALRPGTQMQFDWLVWSAGSTTTVPFRGKTIVSGPFSGCVFAQWEEAGFRYAGHIGTEFDGDAATQRVKRSFLKVLTPTTTGCKPDEDLFSDVASDRNLFNKYYSVDYINLMAFVTPGLQFTTFNLLQLSPLNKNKQAAPEFVVGTVKRARLLNETDIRTFMKRNLPPEAAPPPVPAGLPFSAQPSVSPPQLGRPLPPTRPAPPRPLTRPAPPTRPAPRRP